ncbi:MAG: flagellar export chaperone FliS [Leptospiraceae bacterium]|nr:flagellar export chaperone FliS [Leptospiraceae bacterium]
MSLSKRPGGYSSNSDAYKSNEISTVSQGRLIVMLYEGAIRFLNIAIDCAGNPKKYDTASNNIIKAQEIVNELMISLNMEQGGKVAEDLLAIYVYFKTRLIEANMKKDVKILREIVKLMSELKVSWEEIEKKEASNQTTIPKGGGLSISG